MGTNITDVDVFTDPIVAPADGDPGSGATFQISPQGLANRTRNHKNRLDAIDLLFTARQQHYQEDLDGTATTAGSNMPLNNTGIISDGAFSKTGETIQVPAAGTYAVTITASMTTTATGNPQLMSMTLKRGATTEETQSQHRQTASASSYVPFALSCLVEITTPASERLSVVCGPSGDFSWTGNIQIRRIK
jgi:hypothetical protein